MNLKLILAKIDNPIFITEKNPLIDMLPFPSTYDIDNYSEYPFICHNFHPIMGARIDEFFLKKENIIFNDIIQEGNRIGEQEKFRDLAKRFIENAKTTEKIVEKILNLISNKNGFFQHINKILTEQTSATFLGTLIFTLNHAIRQNYLNIKFHSRVFRKVYLSFQEINNYVHIFKSNSKRFIWNSFTSFYSENSSYLNTNEFNFNTIFIVDFITDSFGVNISKYTFSNINDEILLPAMSLFEIREISKIQNSQGMEILQIELFKIDQNPLEKDKMTILRKEKDFTKILSIVKNEINLLKIAEKHNKNKYIYHQDENNFFLIKLVISGENGTPYEDKVFQVDIETSKNYPNEAPRLIFKNNIWHPNICQKTGILKHQIVGSKWKPSYSVAKLIDKLFNIMKQPDVYQNDIANPEACKEYFENINKFNINAKNFTNQFPKDDSLREDQSANQNTNIMSCDENADNLVKNGLNNSINNGYLIKNFNDNDKNKRNMNNNLEKENLRKNKIDDFHKAPSKSIRKKINNGNYNLNDKYQEKEKKEENKINDKNIQDCSNKNETMEKEENHYKKQKLKTRKDSKNCNMNNKRYSNLFANDDSVNMNSSNNEEEILNTDNFDFKIENNIHNNEKIRRRGTTDFARHGSQVAKKEHLYYEVEFDSRRDINISEIE